MTLPRTVTLDALPSLSRDSLPPLTLKLASRELLLDDIQRFLPGKRLVSFSSAAPQQVYKVFFSDDAGRQAEREATHLRALAQAGLPVPAVHEWLQEQGGAVLVLERIRAARGLSPELVADNAESLARRLGRLIGRLTAAGWVQRDPHPGNFLLAGEQLYLIDGGDLAAVNRRRLQADMALFMAQFTAFPAAFRDPLQALLCDLFGFSPRRFQRRVREQTRERIRRMLAKQRRASTAVAEHWQEDGRVLYARNLRGLDIDEIIAVMREARAGEMLKQGNSATVFRHGELVIKRFNCKSRWHRYKRRLGRDRALNAWCMGRTLHQLGVPTPEPLVYLALDNGLRFLAFERVRGAELSDIMRAGEDTEAALDQARHLLDLMHAMNFWHGDSKARNFLRTGQGMVVIDLDAAGWSASDRRARRMARRDNLRLQRNREQYHDGGH